MTRVGRSSQAMYSQPRECSKRRRCDGHMAERHWIEAGDLMVCSALPPEFWLLLTADVQRYAILYVTPIVNAALAALTTQIAVEYVLAVPSVTEPEQDDLFSGVS